MDTKALRQKILDLAIHGKLVPQDPNDEPASVLLERIRAEKERLIKEGKIKKGKKSAKTSDKPHYPFELPKGWVWVTLEDICAKFSTGPFGSMVHKSDYVTANGVPIVNPANIVNGAISSKNIMYISKDKSIELERYKLEVNDIVLARRGDLTKCTIVGNEQVDFICGTGSFFLHLISVLPQYFQLVYMSSYVQIILATECVGATMNNLNQSVLSQILFPLPPLAEQKRVVARTKYMLSIITTLDNEQYSLHTTIKQAKAKVLDLAIHGKLVSQDPNDEPASELLKRINPKAEIITDNGHYQKLPSGWAICRLEDIVSYEQPTPYIVKSTNYADSYETPVLTAGKSFIIGYTDETAGIYTSLPCIIFDDFTTDSKFVDFPFKVKSSAMKILQVVEDINIEYVSMFMSITRLIGDTHKRYWISEYSKLEIPIPPAEEQKRIVDTVRLIFKKLDSISDSL